MNTSLRMRRAPPRRRAPSSRVPSSTNQTNQISFSMNDPVFVFEGFSPCLPPKPGKIRFLLDVPNYTSANWFHVFFQKDRTLKEWRDEIEELRKPLWFTDVPQIDLGIRIQTAPFDPDGFVNRWTHAKEAADYAEAFLQRNLQMRWIVRKWIARIRERIHRKRIIGDGMDIATHEPIHPRFCVTVADPKSKATYRFHASTLHKTCLESLWYHTYGFASPCAPKNPYTNLPWSLGQLVAIWEQMAVIYMKERHTFMHKHLVSFRHSRYDIETFYEENRKDLHLHAIHTFFKDTSNADFLDTFEEVLLDVLEELDLPKDGRVFQHVSTRSVENRILAVWDDLLATYWIYQNYQEVYHDKYKSFIDLCVGLRMLYGATLDWIVEKNKYVVRRRRQQQAQTLTPSQLHIHTQLIDPGPPSPTLSISVYDVTETPRSDPVVHDTTHESDGDTVMYPCLTAVPLGENIESV